MDLVKNKLSGNYILASIISFAVCCSQKVMAAVVAPSRAHVQFSLFILGAVVVSFGMTMGAFAQDPSIAVYNHDRLDESLQVIFGYLEGSFGAIIMVSAGIGAILSSAFGQYRAALGLLVVAVGAFILRSLTTAFFNTTTVL